MKLGPAMKASPSPLPRYQAAWSAVALSNIASWPGLILLMRNTAGWRTLRTRRSLSEGRSRGR